MLSWYVPINENWFKSEEGKILHFLRWCNFVWITKLPVSVSSQLLTRTTQLIADFFFPRIVQHGTISLNNSPIITVQHQFYRQPQQ